MKWSQARGEAKPTQVSCVIPSRADLADEHERLVDDLRRARREDEELNRDPLAPQLAQRILDLEAEISASEWTFTFCAIGRHRYRRMLIEHPPSPEQAARLKDMDMVAEFNDDTFPPAIMARSCVSVVVRSTDEPIEGIDWQELWDTLSHGQTTRLWRTCVAANTGVAETPKSTAASAVIAASSKS